MNAIGYNAAALGNHEFNYGLEVLEAALAGAQFPALCCNVLRPDGALYFQALDDPSALRARRGRRRARPQGRRRRLRHAADRALGPEPSGGTGDDDRRRRGGARCMSRRAGRRARTSSSRSAIPACRRSGRRGWTRTRGWRSPKPAAIDAIFLGHQHQKLPGADFEGLAGVDAAKGRVGGVPAAMPGFWGSHIGLIDLDARARERALVRRGRRGLAAAGRGRDRRRSRDAGGGRGRPSRDARLCARARRRDRRAAHLLFRHDRRRSQRPHRP